MHPFPSDSEILLNSGGRLRVFNTARDDLNLNNNKKLLLFIELLFCKWMETFHIHIRFCNPI